MDDGLVRAIGISNFSIVKIKVRVHHMPRRMQHCCRLTYSTITKRGKLNTEHLHWGEHKRYAVTGHIQSERASPCGRGREFVCTRVGHS